MAGSLFSPRELLFAVAATALAGFGALALSHGQYSVPIMVEIAMVAGFASILRLRDAAMKGRRLFPWEPWTVVVWFGFAALMLIVAPAIGTT